MTKITLDANQWNSQYIKITAEFDTPEEIAIIQLPSWRPGRYELGNFAKNVRNFKVFDQNRVPLEFRKIKKDRWVVGTESCSKIEVSYSFYANEINAGSTCLDENQLYVNPVNCCVYTESTYHDKVSVELKTPAHWDLATSMEIKDGMLIAENFEELLDSPFIVSSQLQHRSYESFGTIFHVWFNGEVKPDWDRLLADFQKFTDKQIEKFTEFPVKEYHYINQILPYKAYHGVEHQKSTVISLGPSYDIFGSLYKELLGVSAHELYHTWNVKAIRPIEMFPYDFTKENYSRLGYICEGVTTYQGDLFLYKSGVFNEAQYFLELTNQLQRHFDNAGRFNYSVGDSSFDTWLDGYVAGAPGRKVSIYTEGCLLAFVTDIMILQATKEKYGLDEVMKRLYFNFALQGKGVSEKDYKQTLESVSGISFENFFDDYINGTRPYESIITQSFEYLGLELSHEPSNKYSEGQLGFRTVRSGDNFIIKSMYPGGPAETAKLMLEDEIIAVNGFKCAGELDKWLSYFDDNTKTVTIIRGGVLKDLTFPEVMRPFYMRYSISKVDNPDGAQKKAYKAWIR
ncbi:MAG: PDZ domain-containing protein [Crocinitomicaceae bacterium]|nr:PDZ domain-containing protein [Crocinitomicaceae bacterium]